MIRRDNNTQDEAGQNKKYTYSTTQSGQERVMCDVCVFKKLAGLS